MPRLTDLWRPAIIRAPIAELIERGTMDGLPIRWLPTGRPFTFTADPFGLWRDGKLHIFVEAYDYRTRIGRIDVLIFDKDLELLDCAQSLCEPWHLSYPFIFESDGKTWLLPEAHRSGTLTLYRATTFPTGWEAVGTIALDSPAVDASPIFFEGRWWLLYSPSTSKVDKISRLHVAFADRLEGPWHLHPANPVRIDRTSARPGGRPFVAGNMIIAPMQDCSRTYGGAIRPLRITCLTPTRFEAEAGTAMTPPSTFAPYVDGLHTLSGCGDLTLIDAKRVDRTLRGWSLDLSYRLRRMSSRCRNGNG